MQCTTELQPVRLTGTVKSLSTHEQGRPQKRRNAIVSASLAKRVPADNTGSAFLMHFGVEPSVFCVMERMMLARREWHGGRTRGCTGMRMHPH